AARSASRPRLRDGGAAGESLGDAAVAGGRVSADLGGGGHGHGVGMVGAHRGGGSARGGDAASGHVVEAGDWAARDVGGVVGWGGRGGFHQAPLYAYVLAAMRWVVGDGIWAIELCHLGLGLVNVCLITLLADRMFGRLAALVAGLGAALYGPFMLFETFLLRDTLAVTTALLLLVMLTGADGARRWHWFAAGAFFALAVLARETTLLFAPFVVLWVVQRFGPRPAVCATVLLSFVVGALVVFLPLVARNLVVGVVPWALSTRGAEAFIAGHAAGGSPFGYALPPAFRSVLEA